MQSLLNFINEERMVREAFESSILKDLDKALKSRNDEKYYYGPKSFKDMTRFYYGVTWSSIKDSDFEEIKVVAEDGTKNASAEKFIKDFVRGKKSGVIIGKKGEKFKYMIDSMLSWKVLDSDSQIFSDVKYIEHRGRVAKRAPQYAYIDAMQYGIDTILYLKSEALSISKEEFGKLRLERNQAQKGIIPVGDPSYNKRLAAENVKRYKDIINKHKIEREQGKVKEVAEKVQNIVNAAMEITTKVMTEPDKYFDARWTTGWLLDKINSKESYNQGRVSGYRGLLDLFSSYMKNVLDLANGEAYNSDSTAASVKRLEVELDKKIHDIEKYIKEIESKRKSDE